MCPPFDDRPNWSGEELVPIYHKARDKATRMAQEPGARVGDTEWAICNKYKISYNKFRSMNGLPSREEQPSVIIEVGRNYIVGYKEQKKVNIPWSHSAGEGGSSSSGPKIPATGHETIQPKHETSHAESSGSFNISSSRKPVSALRASQPFIKYLKSWERPPLRNGKISGQVFRDTKGSLTIGYGHWIKETERWRWKDYDPELGGTKSLSMLEIEQLFQDDVNRLAEAEVKKRIRVKLRQNEYDALVDLAYHRGGGALRDSGLESYINSIPSGNFDYGKIKDAFMKYAYRKNTQTGQWEFVKGFEKRRKEEIDLFQNGNYTLHR